MSVFLKNVISLSLGNQAAQVIALCLTPIITRLYLPEEYGLFAIFLSVLMVIAPTSTLQYHNAIMLPKSNQNALNIYAISVVSSVLFSILVSLIIVLICMFQFLEFSKMTLMLFLLPMAVFLQGFLTASISLNIRRKQFGYTSVARIVESMSDRMIALILGVLGSGVLGLVSARIAGSFFSILTIFGFWRRKEMSLNLSENIKKETMKEMLLRYKAFPIYSSFATILNTMSRETPTFLLAIFFTPLITGLYALAMRVVNLPMMIVGDAMSKVYFQKASEIKKQKEDLRKISNELIGYIFYLIIPPTIALLFFGDYLFEFIFGSEWKNSGVYSQILCISFAAMFLNRPLATLFDVFEKQRQKLIFNLSLFIGRAASILISFYLSGSVVTVITVLSIVTTIIHSTCFYYLISLVEIKGIDLFKIIINSLSLLLISILLIPIIHHLSFITMFQKVVIVAAIILLQFAVIAIKKNIIATFRG